MSEYGVGANINGEMVEVVKPKIDERVKALEDKTVNVKDFGAKGDGVTDDTVAIQNALNSGKPVQMPDVYSISAIEVPEGAKIEGNPTFILNGTDYRTGVLVRSNAEADCITVVANEQLNSQAVYLSGDNIHIKHITVRNVNRAIAIGAGRDIVSGTGKTATGKTHYKNIHVDGYDIDSCVQGVKFTRASYCQIGSGKIICLPDEIQYTPAPGLNGFLIVGSDNLSIGNVFMDRCLEHAVRIGGDEGKVDTDTENYATHDVHFGDIISYRHGGSAFKVNPGYYKKAYNITANEIVSVDAGMRNRENTRRLSTLRLSFCNGFDCGSVISRYTNEDVSPEQAELYETDVVEIQDSSNIDITNLNADVCGRSMICFHEGNDDNSIPYSDQSCFNIDIHNITCKNSFATSFYLCKFYNTGMKVNAVNLKSVYLYGDKFAGYFASMTEDNTSGIFVSCLDRHNKAYDLAASVAVSIESNASRQGASIIKSTKQFNITDALKTSSLAIYGNRDTESSGFGATIVFPRLASYGRPGAGIALNQVTANSGNCGLSFLVGTSQTSTNSLKEAWQMVPASNALQPAGDNNANLGSTTNRVANIYAASGSINTSDEREKTTIVDVNEALMRAWGKIGFKVYQFKDAVKEKGAKARLHVGLIAQKVIEAFKSEGLDAGQYGLLCHDTWDAYDESVVVVDKPAVLDANGNEVEAEVAHTEIVHHEAGDRYGIRYEEALALECAYQRWRMDKLEAMLNDKA